MTYSQIKSRVYLLTKTNVVSLTDADFVLYANSAYERVVSLIMQSDGRWQWDDSNQTDLPIGTTTITTDQQDYSLAVTDLQITRVELKDTDANWRELIPIDQTDVYDTSLTDLYKTSNVPVYYDKIANSIFLYPKPNYTQAASLKIYFKRPPSLFASTDTTKVPGFNSLYHDLISLIIAHDYAIANGLPNANLLEAEVMKKQEALQEDYALRSKDEHLIIAPRRGSFR